MSAAAAPARASAPAGVVRYWTRQGGESLAVALQIISDLTAQEVALVVGMLRERITLRPAVSTVETAGDVVTGFTDAGKILLDLTADESAVFTDALKEALRLRPSIAALVDLIPRGVGTLIEMHKHLLDMVAGQTRELVEAYKDDKPLMAGTRLSKFTRQTIESFIETQKTFLDQVAEQVNIATQGKEPKATRRERSKVLTQLAREGVEKFIDAQRGLLEVAMERMEGPERVRTKPVPRTSLAAMARESVQNFTTAQKSLLDLALKPIAMPVEADKKPRPARAPPEGARCRQTAGRSQEGGGPRSGTRGGSLGRRLGYEFVGRHFGRGTPGAARPLRTAPPAAYRIWAYN